MSSPTLGGLLLQAVRQRKPGDIMPTFTPADLNDEDVRDISRYLGSLTPAPNTAPQLGVAEAGGQPYRDNCGKCHGAKDEGRGGRAPALAMMANGLKQGGAPANVISALVMLASRSGNLPHMPTFAPVKLSDTQLTDIAAFIWSLPAPPAPATPPPAK